MITCSVLSSVVMISVSNTMKWISIAGFSREITVEVRGSCTVRMCVGEGGWAKVGFNTHIYRIGVGWGRGYMQY